MLFNGYPFLLVFLPAVAAGFFLLRRQRLRLLLLVGASYVFYAYADPWFMALMAASTAITFTGGLLIGGAVPGLLGAGGVAARLARRRGRVLATGIVAALALLAYYKYAGFAAGYAMDVLQTITGEGFPGVRAFTNGIVLPIGISFYTFEGISYMVDVYRGEIPAERNPLRYSLFISFFPHLIAGPIVRYGVLAPQLRQRVAFDPERIRSGLMLFSLGLAKKTLVADGLAHWTNPYLARPDTLGLLEAWAAALGFGFQIYFDFSAYSDMALGLARIFGITLPWNFDRPYRAATPSEFWRRWHVTLSSWLRDYLYIPLGGNRKGPVRRDVNLFATMAIGGLWHGAAFTFVLWGIWHGVLLVAHRRLAPLLPFRVPRPVAVLLTFTLVTLAWVLFRMPTLGGAGQLYASMFAAHGIGAVPGRLLAYLLVAAAIVWGLPEEWRWQVGSWGWPRVAVVGGLAAVAAVSIATTTPFIYFRF